MPAGAAMFRGVPPTKLAKRVVFGIKGHQTATPVFRSFSACSLLNVSGCFRNRIERGVRCDEREMRACQAAYCRVEAVHGFTFSGAFGILRLTGSATPPPANGPAERRHILPR